jgi:Fe-S cluster assembly scaffold protein SufB
MKLFNLADTDAEKIVLRLEPRVFFLWNRSGNFEFSFEKSGSEARIFALFIGKKDEEFSLSIVQRHHMPDTKSHLTVLSILDEHARLSFDGLIRIEKNASRSDTSQQNKNFLLSESARAVSKPTMEILAHDVSARHASATGTIDSEAILFAETHGIAHRDAKKLLAEGAVRNFFDEMRKYTDNPTVGKFEKEAIQMLFSHRERASLTKRKKLTEGRTR